MDSTIKLSPQIYLYSGEARPEEIPAECLALRQLPGKVFGDGTHPTTRLCAGAVDLLCRQQLRPSVLDVGTGTGVLARIARARGTHFVVGTDIDPEARTLACANAALDTHAIKIQISSNAPDFWGARFDLVVANILEGPLRSLAPALARSVTSRGLLLISGFTPRQTPALRIAFVDAGLTYLSESVLDGWALLMFQA